MIEGQSFLCFAPGPWDDIWRNRHQIMTRLARRNKVLWIEPRAYLRPTLRQLRRGKIGWRDLRRPLAVPVRDNLWVYRDPVYAPIAGRRFHLGAITQALRVRAMKKTMRRLGFGRPLLWLTRYYQADVVGTCGERLVIYHISDEYSAYAAVRDPEAVRRAEAELIRRADLVLVTSPALLESKRPLNPHTYLVPNAADVEGFARAAADPTVPPRMTALPRPIVGYVGALNEKLDYELIRSIALARPEWSIALVGPLGLYSQPHKADGIKTLPNVHLLGRVDVSEVPYYIKSCDVCLLPYERNEWTRNIDSLKLYEYLACGRPVVATDIPAARGFSDLVYIVRDAPEALDAIQAALGESTLEMAHRRQAAVAGHTWDARVEQISQLVSEALQRTKGRD
ncbi:MAG: glycosyltransferase [Anaerolineae bacterium]|nr:glycosyltransferase [Anaerolineae bacterium]